VSTDDEDLIALSYLSQFYYCQRRAGLLLLEQQWDDNALTAEGDALHRRVHDRISNVSGDRMVLRGVGVSSRRLGLLGVIDYLEFVADPGGDSIEGLPGKWIVNLVEYKHGEIREEPEYEVQLCAQAMCLEEMTGVRLSEGYIFYEEDHRRHLVTFTPALRALVEAGARSLRDMLRTGNTPSAEYGPKCKKCSMVEVCIPRVKRGAAAYLRKMKGLAMGERA